MKYEDLKILDELKEKGSITQEEYEREKAKILNSDASSQSGTSSFKPLFGLDEKTYIMLMHLSQLLGLMMPLFGFIAPVLMWITNKENNANVDLHGKNILNFILSYLIYATVLAITIIGIPLAVVVGILYVIFVIMASVKANKGEYWKYPLTIELIK